MSRPLAARVATSRVRDVFVVGRAFGAHQNSFGTSCEVAGGSANPRDLGLACPPVLPSSCEISSRAELPGSATQAFCELGCGAAAPLHQARAGARTGTGTWGF